MITLEQIEAAILQLPPDELRRLQEWLMDLAERGRDEQLEQDVAEGKLE